MLACGNLFSQSLPSWNQGNQITVVQGDTILSFAIVSPPGTLRTSTDLIYYWFDQGHIGKSQGGFTGQLLDGAYEAKLRKGGPIRKGNFRDGLRIGTWLEWYPNGKIKRSDDWRNGQRHGKASTYDAAGGLIREASYRNNELHGTVTEYGNGNAQMIRYKHGVIVLKKEKVIKPPRIKKSKPDAGDSGKVKKRSKKINKTAQPKDSVSVRPTYRQSAPETVQPPDTTSPPSSDNTAPRRRSIFRKKEKP